VIVAFSFWSAAGRANVGVLAAFNYTAIAAAAVTGLTAVIVGLIGYFTARLSANVAREQVISETRRLEAEHREVHFRDRQSVYHKIFNADLTLLTLLNGQPDFTRAEAFDAYRALGEELNGAKLFGTTSVDAAAAHLDVIVGWVMQEADEGADTDDQADEDGTWAEAAKSAMIAHGADWIRARQQLADAIRADVAVDRKPADRETFPPSDLDGDDLAAT
jgi:hypothetical protein